MFLNALLLKAGCAIVIIRKLAAQAGMGNLQIVSSTIVGVTLIQSGGESTKRASLKQRRRSKGTLSVASSSSV